MGRKRLEGKKFLVKCRCQYDRVERGVGEVQKGKSGDQLKGLEEEALREPGDFE